MKTLFLGMCLTLCSIGLFAQKFSVSGTVTDEKGNALVGATVSIKNSYVGTYTDSKGFYSLDKISKGTYVIMVSYVGYATVEKSVGITANTIQNISLVEKAIHIQAVTITAIKAKETTPVAQTNVVRSEIVEQNLAQDIPYQLEQTPSTVATSENGTGMGYTGMRIRGTDMSRINVTINGIPYNDAESQGVFWVDMADFSSSVDEIQIQRGVGTSTNGASSFGASINFQTIAVEEKPFARVSSTIGSFNTFKESVAIGTGIIDSCFGISARYSKLNSKGWIERGFSDHQSLHITSTYFKKNNSLTANVLLGQEQTGITWWGVPSDVISVNRQYNPSGKYYDYNGNVHYYGETDNYIQNHYMMQYKHDFSNYLNSTISFHATTGKGYYEEYKSQFDDWGTENTFELYGLQNVLLQDTVLEINGNPYVFPDSTIYSSDMLREKWLDNIYYGCNASLNYSKDNLDWNFGTGYTIYEGNHFGIIKDVKFIPDFTEYTWYTNESEKNDFNAFTKIQYKLSPKFTMYADVQYRFINYIMNGIDDDLYTLNQTHTWEFVNPKAGVFYKINKQNTVFTSFAMANREPARADLKDFGKDGVTKAPKPETLYDYEFGYNYTAQNVGIGVNLYYMQYANQLVLTGKVNDVGYPIMENVKESYRRGLEFTIGARPMKEISWNGNFTLSQNKILQYIEYSTDYDDNWNEIQYVKNLGTTDISYSPNAIASSTISFHPDKKMSFGITSKYVGDQYFDNTSDVTRKLESYTVHNFQLNYKVPIKKSELQIQLLVNNLLDTQYVSNAYGGNWFEQGQEKSWMYYFPQAGINYMCKATFDF